MSVKIAVIGSGYVGLVSGTCFAELGHNVVCVDHDKNKIDGILAGKLPIYEPGLEDLVRRNIDMGRLSFSTDTASALRAAEIEADIIFKATKVDGVYDSDPAKNPDAKRYESLSFMEVLEQELGVMDSTAASMCKDNNIPILVFSLADPDNIVSAVMGEEIGTIVR